MKTRLQFGLRTLFLSTSVAAMLAAGVYWWQWWNYTRHMRALCDAVSISTLDPESKLILNKLAWKSSAWDSGLIRALTGPFVKHVVWQAKTRIRNQDVWDIYIFDAFVRPAAGAPIPPVCVVLDKHGNLVTWANVAGFSMGFLHATLDNDDVLTIVTAANWFAGKGTYRYAIRERSIVALDDGNFGKFENDEDAKSRPRLMPLDPAFDDIL